jgi:hypothetical protein
MRSRGAGPLLAVRVRARMNMELRDSPVAGPAWCCTVARAELLHGCPAALATRAGRLGHRRRPRAAYSLQAARTRSVTYSTQSSQGPQGLPASRPPQRAPRPLRQSLLLAAKVRAWSTPGPAARAQLKGCNPFELANSATRTPACSPRMSCLGAQVLQSGGSLLSSVLCSLAWPHRRRTDTRSACCRLKAPRTPLRATQIHGKQSVHVLHHMKLSQTGKGGQLARFGQQRCARPSSLNLPLCCLASLLPAGLQATETYTTCECSSTTLHSGLVWPARPALRVCGASARS